MDRQRFETRTYTIVAVSGVTMVHSVRHGPIDDVLQPERHTVDKVCVEPVLIPRSTTEKVKVTVALLWKVSRTYRVFN